MTRKQIRRTIRRALTAWRPITDTEHWEIGVNWHDSPDSADGSVMGMYCKPAYEEATLFVNQELILHDPGMTRAVLWYTVLHELCHCHTAMLARLAEQRAPEDRVADANELATKKMSSAIWRARYGTEPPSPGA